MPITIKTDEEVQAMREGGRKLAEILILLGKYVKSGVRLSFLEEKAKSLVKRAGCRPAFLGYMGYPCVLCASVNEEVVHGIATRDIILKEGDVVGIDMGLEHNGMIVDSAITVLCGSQSKRRKEGGREGNEERLIRVCRSALNIGIEQVKDGATTGDIGFAVQNYVEKNGYSVVRELVGHGVGREVHEDPQIPNFGRSGAGTILESGMTIAIEPMITLGSPDIRTLDDEWTVVTKDGSLSAHFEHTVLVTEMGAEVLTKI